MGRSGLIGRPRKRSGKAADAARLMVESDMTDAQIAAELEIGINTLKRLRDDAEFPALFAEAEANMRVKLRRFPVARQYVRMSALQKQFERLMELFSARAAQALDPTKPAVTGMDTGLIAAETKMAASGATVQAWGFDSAPYKALLDTLKQAAIEGRDWNEKSDGTMNGAALREEALRLAAEYGVEVAEMIAMAEQILAGKA